MAPKKKKRIRLLSAKTTDVFIVHEVETGKISDVSRHNGEC